MIEACGVCEQREEATRLFQDIKKNSIEPSIATFNSYFQACSVSLNTGHKGNAKSETKKGKKETELVEDKKSQSLLLKMLHKVIVELTTKCFNPECGRYLKEEEIISAWPKNLHTYSIKCPTCNKDFIPNLDVQFSEDEIEHYYFLFPPLFAKEVYNLIDSKSSNVFFTVLLLYILGRFL